MMAGLDKLSVVQQIVTPLAFTLLILYSLTRRSYLFIPAMVLGLFAVLLWLARRRYEGDLYKRALQHAERGEHQESLALLVRAEEAWALNEAHSTPKTIKNDFQRLAAIVASTQSQVNNLGGELNSKELAKAIEVYIDVYSNKKNLVFGTHRLKASAQSEIKQVNEIFPVLRGRFREACQELYRTLGSQPTQGL